MLCYFLATEKLLAGLMDWSVQPTTGFLFLHQKQHGLVLIAVS